jgi:hypothetical protein
MTAVVKPKPPVAREMESEIGELRSMVSAVRNAWFDSLEHIPPSREQAERAYGITNLLVNQLWDITERFAKKIRFVKFYVQRTKAAPAAPALCQLCVSGMLNSHSIPASRKRRTISTAVRHRSYSNSCWDWWASFFAGRRAVVDGI